MHWKDEIGRIVAEVERAAYKKGWDDALTHVLSVARNPVQPSQRSLPLIADHNEVPQSPAKPLIDMVHEAIVSSPGLRGAAIVSQVHMANPGKDRKSIDRTARTALQRLKKRNKIESRDGRWYPKEAA